MDEPLPDELVEGRDLSELAKSAARLHCYYFVHGGKAVSRPHVAAVKDYCDTNGGMRLYHTGFRVLPYGERGDDWLDIDATSRSRSILEAFGTINFVGRVEIDDPSRRWFEETSSREGLTETDASHSLQWFALTVLDQAVRRITSVRRKLEEEQSQDPGVAMAQANVALGRLARHLNTQADTLDKAGHTEFALAVRETRDELTEVVDMQRKASDRILEENELLRVFAALGLAIGEFVHEVRPVLGGLDWRITELQDHEDVGDSILELLGGLRQQVESARQYLRYFEFSVSEQSSRELRPLNLRMVVNDFVTESRQSLQRRGIEVHGPEFGARSLQTCPMHYVEWTSILHNLLTNSIKAIHRRAAERGSAGAILLRAGKADGNVFVDFADNGDGIPEKNRSRIFDALFTTSAPIGAFLPQADDLLGSGLGLKLVRDILRARGGDVTLVDPPTDEYATCFRVIVPEDTV